MRSLSRDNEIKNLHIVSENPVAEQHELSKDLNSDSSNEKV